MFLICTQKLSLIEKKNLLNAGQRYCRMLREHSAILSTFISFSIFYFNLVRYTYKYIQVNTECKRIRTKAGSLCYSSPRASLSYHLSLRSLFCLFLSCCLRQVLLYLILRLWKMIQQRRNSEISNECTNHIKVKPVISCHSKMEKKVLKTNGSLMKVDCIAECSLGAFCKTLSNNRSWKPISDLLFEWPLKTGFTAH